MKTLKITKTRNDRYLVESYINGLRYNTMYISKAQMIALRQSGIKCIFGNTER